MTQTENDIPVVRPFPAAQAPTPPPGLAATYFTGPDGGQSPFAPVVLWQGYTYWVYGTVISDWTMHIIAYDADGQPKKRIDKGDSHRIDAGARYLWLITVDEERRSITLFGQDNRRIVVSWNELAVG
jgi:hypothetical protein